MRFRAERAPGSWFAQTFAKYWPAYRGWWLSEAISNRPSYLEAEGALAEHMPELLTSWHAALECTGGGDLEARFLSMWCPPPTVVGCAQAVRAGPKPLLVHNYDYTPRLFDGIVLHSEWCGTPVVATTDCLLGALDGLNARGLAVSLNFGGDETVGPGFGAPMVARYILETCATVADAAAVLTRIPTHMAYNFLLLDSSGAFVTVYTAPGGGVRLHDRAHCTNHQETIQWPRHARLSETVARDAALAALVADDEADETAFVEAFLNAPLYVTNYERGMGTLYTATFRPAQGRVTYQWPGLQVQQSLSAFRPGTHALRLSSAPGPLAS
ncbi:MAG: C45 family autoproteolytic acyltransferase/hydrolase [Planctomycetota bacterium]|nr:C45 family autoproteolytic acyltransferase/hydrolase [Planctomycetota bacterium]